jgi:hypothetical protein
MLFNEHSSFFRFAGAASVSFVLLSFLSSLAVARPEYAAKEKRSCIACHANPWGGGPRNVFGKVYGSRGLKPSKLSNSDLYYADLRFIDYLPTQPAQTTNGLAVMEAAVTGNVPIYSATPEPQQENKNEQSSSSSNNTEFRAVLTYNIAPLGGSQLRDAYLSWNTSPASPNDSLQFLLGHFYVPFGLLTDEHRTYTKLQTNMTYNNYDVGVGFSGTFWESLHTDVAVVNDFQTGGAFSNQDVTLGFVTNVRWNPESLPFFIGASGNYEYTTNQPNPYALATYGVFSFDRLTKNSISASLLFERVDAQNWNNPALNNGGINPGLPIFFIPKIDSAYQAFVLTSSSLGYYGLARYNFTPQFTLFYKFDYLALDRNYTSDAYLRHGFGFEAYLYSNLLLNVRYELPAGMRPEIASSNVLAAQENIFAMLRLWI